MAGYLVLCEGNETLIILSRQWETNQTLHHENFLYENYKMLIYPIINFIETHIDVICL